MMTEAGGHWVWVALEQRVCGTDAAVTALAHRSCVCVGVPGDACVNLLIWPGVSLIGFRYKQIIS